MDPAQLQQVESLAEVLFGQQAGLDRAGAQQQLMALQSGPEYIPQCQYILDNSNSPYAHFVASESLEKLITQFWNNFTVEQKIELQKYVLDFLGEKGVSLDEFVVSQLAKLTCRITKMGWFDDLRFRNIIQEITRFLQATIDHHLIGLRILNELVDEMNTPTSGRSLTQHRKTAVSFRDHSLYRVFQIAITALKHLSMDQIEATLGQQVKMGELALKLATKCLSFDFIGTNPDESAEDIGTVQVPSSWKPIVQDTSTVMLFLDFYKNTEPPQSNQALEAIVQLSSVRRSLFGNEKERANFLGCLMGGIQDIMSTKHGLDHTDNYHEFCRLLGRLKANYQLTELLKTPNFGDWLTQAAEFTIASFQNWQYSQNSIHYLLALWSRLVAAIPYVRNEGEAHRQAEVLRNCVMRVLESYIHTMINSVEFVVRSNDTADDPLDQEGTLKEQLERLPVLARAQYDHITSMLGAMYNDALSQYQTILDMAGMGIEVTIMEGKLAWLTYMVGAIIGSSSANDPRRGAEDQTIDANLCRGVFQLVQGVDFRLTSSNGQAQSDVKLEMAILYFMRMFKKVYLAEHLSGSALPTATAHPLLSLALNYAGMKSDGASGDQEKPHQQFFEVLQSGDLNGVMNLVITKLCNNIKYWNDEEELLRETLEVFTELVTSYGSCKTLLSLDTVNFLVHNHTGDHFPFLSYADDNKHRIGFYQALARLVFSSAEDLNNEFDVFMEPILQILGQLNETENLRQPQVKVALVGVLRDLRGITAATHGRRTYGLLFEALYPTFFPVFFRAAETWADDPQVTTALLKFLQEFAYNKAQRVQFDQSSANGILLFREISNIVCAYGSRIMDIPVNQDIWIEKYKGIRLMLNVLTCALSGNYVNFGVFALYNDKALENALDVSLQLCLSIPLADAISYIKLSKAYFAFLEILFRNHLDVLSNLDSPVFLQLVRTVHEGLQINGEDLPICAFCASAIDHLATYIFLNQRKDKPTVQMIRSHVASEPEILTELMTTLFNQLLFGTNSNQWAISRPILSLMLASEDAFGAYKAQLISSQPPENQVKLEEEFNSLVTDFQRSVETAYRDKFTQKLNAFRLHVRNFLSL